MKCGSWGKEPFDLRLTILRFFRCLPVILALTLAGTLCFGGGYYLKNVVFYGEDTYTAKATFLVDYTDENWATNLKYVNEYSWNQWLGTDTLQNLVKGQLPDGAFADADLGKMLHVTVYYDLRMPELEATAETPDKAEMLRDAASRAITEDFPAVMEDVKAIRSVDVTAPAKDVPDVRPVRAFVLAAVLSFFFAGIGFLVRELTLEQIWLPTALTDIYGLKELGVPGTTGFAKNLQYFLKGKKRVAVCPAEEGMETEELLKSIREHIGPGEQEINVVAYPLQGTEDLEVLRQQDGVLLAVNAGCDGKKLGALLHFLEGQDVAVTAGLLWKQDGWLVRNYYRLGGKVWEKG